VMTMAAAVAQAYREEGKTALLKITTQSSLTGKTRVGYFKAGWTDNNLPLVGSKAGTLPMSPEFAERIRANVQARIEANGGAVHTGRFGSITGIEVVDFS
jgi:hypothetical protein